MHKRIVSILLALLLAFGFILGGFSSVSASADDFNIYIQELTQLVQETWSVKF